jgi:DNA-binding response OmpR family regulator
VEALRICAEHGSPVDLLVTDRGLPDMTGREVARRLTAVHPALRVLHISGYTREHDSIPGAPEPGVPFLQKPFTAAELTATVRDLLSR